MRGFGEAVWSPPEVVPQSETAKVTSDGKTNLVVTAPWYERLFDAVKPAVPYASAALLAKYGKKLGISTPRTRRPTVPAAPGKSGGMSTTTLLVGGAVVAVIAVALMARRRK